MAREYKIIIIIADYRLWLRDRILKYYSNRYPSVDCRYLIVNYNL